MTEVISMWQVYRRPRDYPRWFVARRVVITNGTARHGANIIVTDEVLLGQTLDHLRQQLPPGLFRLDPMPGDHPKMLEVWL